MKKKFLIVVSLFLFLFIPNISLIASVHPELSKESNKEETIDFKKEPVKYMVKIYNYYHNWQVDKGIEKALAALRIVDELYRKDPNTAIKDPKLKKNKAYEIKSTLHTLLGMLYYRKALKIEREARKKEFAPVLEKIKKGKTFTEADLEEVERRVKSNERSRDKVSFIEKAKEQFRIAIKVDPSNPSPHFQLGSIYSAMSAPGETEEAEKELYLAAKLSYEEGDMQAVNRAIEVLKSVNERSMYLSIINKLMKGRNK